jgi:hypothetical protein
MERSRGKGGKAVPLTTQTRAARKAPRVPAKYPERNEFFLKFDFLNKTRYTQYNNPPQKLELPKILPTSSGMPRENQFILFGGRR